MAVAVAPRTDPYGEAIQARDVRDVLAATLYPTAKVEQKLALAVCREDARDVDITRS